MQINQPCIVYNNLSYSNEYNLGFDIGGHDAYIYFNTFVNHTNTGTRNLKMYVQNVDNIFKNNLFIEDAAVNTKGIMQAETGHTLALIAANNTFDNNLYYYNGVASAHIMYDSIPTYLQFSEWQALGGSPDANSHYLASLPQFVTRYSNFHPLEGENLDQHDGVAITGYETDLDSHARSNPPNCGCYEEHSA